MPRKCYLSPYILRTLQAKYLHQFLQLLVDFSPFLSCLPNSSPCSPDHMKPWWLDNDKHHNMNRLNSDF